MSKFKPPKGLSPAKIADRESKKLRIPETIASIDVRNQLMKHDTMRLILEHFGYKATRSIVQQVSGITQHIVQQLAGVTPVDTGYMRGHWTARIVGNKIVVGNNMMYAKFVVFGTRHMRANGALLARLKLLELEITNIDILKGQK